ncbi:MAG: amidohydrolase family protein [Clostridia bacterium]|nr:amidohydrolase family protein [Clostridia bacterium]
MRIIDSHVHLEKDHPEVLLQLADRYHFEKIAFQGIPCEEGCGLLNGIKCLLAKRLAPGRVYAYNSMVYPKGLAATAKTHEKQLSLIMDAGFDGWKILETKPSLYRNIQIPLDGEVFSRAFAMAESENIPITWHAGDPATFWDEKKAPEFAVRNGWLCIGEGFPKLEEIYSQVENVLEKHPKLRVSMAHLYFISDDRAHGERLLDKYENFFLDITPGNEMYFAFLSDREGWKAFFEKYKEKLVFGTDMIDSENDIVFNSQDDMNKLIFDTLTTEKQVTVFGANGIGLGLSSDACDKIFSENFENRAGKTPRPISISGLNAYAEWLMPYLSKEEQKCAEDLLSF